MKDSRPNFILGISILFTLATIFGCSPDNDSGQKSNSLKIKNHPVSKDPAIPKTVTKAYLPSNESLNPSFEILSDDRFDDFKITFTQLGNESPEKSRIYIKELFKKKDPDQSSKSLSRLSELFTIHLQLHSNYSNNNATESSFDIIVEASKLFSPEILFQVLNNNKNPTIETDLGAFLSKELALKLPIEKAVKLSEDLLKVNVVSFKAKLYDNYLRSNFSETIAFLKENETLKNDPILIKNISNTLVEFGAEVGASIALTSSTTSRDYSVIRDYVEIWMEYNSLKATKWADTLQDQKAKDAASVAIVDFLSRSKQFTEAEVWLNSINDKELNKKWVDMVRSRK